MLLNYTYSVLTYLPFSIKSIKQNLYLDIYIYVYGISQRDRKYIINLMPRSIRALDAA